MTEDDKEVFKISCVGCTLFLGVNLLLWFAIVYGIIAIIKAFA